MTLIVEKVAKPLKIKVCGMRDPQNIADLIQLPIDYMGFIFYEKSPRYVADIPDWATFKKLPNLKHIKRVGVFVNADIDFVLDKIEQFNLDVVQLHGKETPQYLRELKIKNEELKATHLDLTELKTSLRGTKQKNKELNHSELNHSELNHSELNPNKSNSENSSLMNNHLSLINNHSSLIEIWKAFSVDEIFDFETTTPYENIADKFLFDTKTPQHGGSGQKFDWHILKKYVGETPFFLSGGISAADTEGVKNITHPQLFGLDINSKFEIAPALKDVPLLKKFIDAVLTRYT